jgi:pimeloyl-ACP methyl ester carboxylesterase
MRDRVFNPSLAKRLAAQFPNSTMIEVPEDKTFVALDDPSAVVDAIATIGAHSA